MMKRHILSLVLLLATGIPVAAQTSDVMVRQSDGTYIVNTTSVCDARGYRNATPVEVHIKNGMVVKVVALKNQETAAYFSKIKKFLLPLYDNLKIGKAKKQAAATEIDGCTGATFSTKAVQKNIKAALEYYEKHK